MPENNQQKQSISQSDLDQILRSLEEGGIGDDIISFSELLEARGFDQNLSLKSIDLTNLSGKRIDFSGVDLSRSNIICDNREDLTFGDDSGNVARLNHTIIRTFDDKTHYLNSNDEGRIFEFVIDKTFKQSDLMSKYKFRLSQKGVCFALVNEEARHNLKHNILDDLRVATEKDFAQKLERKIQNMSIKFLNRLQYYHSNSDLRLPYERDLDIPYDSILNNIPGEMQDSKVLGVIFNTHYPGMKPESHIISISKIEREGDDNKYQIFDPNYGFSFCKTKEEVNKQLEAIIYPYQNSVPEGFDKKIRLTDLEKYVRESELLPLEGLSKKENKNRKYKHSQRDYSESLIKVAQDSAPIGQIKWLIERGADRESKNDKGETPLHIASEHGHKDIVDLLLYMGADRESKNDKGETPLHIASEHGHENIVDYLLRSRGAQVDAANKDGETPLHFAAGDGHKNIVDLLLWMGADREYKNNYGSTPLHIAAANGKTDVIALFLDRGAEVNAKTDGGSTPLHLAACGHTDSVKLLIARGADIDAKNDEGNTPLNLAAQHGYKDIVDLLIQNHADIEVINKDGWTPLHLAAGDGYGDESKDIVNLLLNRGAQVDAQDKDGKTPLHLAAQNARKDIVELLIERGAKVNKVDNYGHSALDIARGAGRSEIVELLEAKSAPVLPKPNFAKQQIARLNAIEAAKKIGAGVTVVSGNNVRKVPPPPPRDNGAKVRR